MIFYLGLGANLGEREKTLRRVLFAGTGALLSGVSPLQGESVPGIAHAVLLTSGEDER